MQPGMIVGHQDVAPYNAVMDGDRLAGFFDWDIAFPSPPEEDLAFAALLWVPLTAPEADEEPGAHDVADRSRRLHLFLGAYRYDGDREAFAAAIVQRARRQASALRSKAEAGDRAATGLLPIASRLEQAASYVEALAGGFLTAFGQELTEPETSSGAGGPAARAGVYVLGAGAAAGD